MSRLARIAPFVLLVACGDDLPEGWEDAEPVTSLIQSDCDGNPYEDYDERVEADISSSPYAVDLLEGHFRCAQEVEGFYRVEGGSLEVLVQPIDMDPKVVAGCDCLYDIEMTVVPEVDLAPDAVSVYRRWDNINEPNDPVLVGTVERDD